MVVAVTAANRADTVVNKVAKEAGSRRFDDIPVLAFPARCCTSIARLLSIVSPTNSLWCCGSRWFQGAALFCGFFFFLRKRLDLVVDVALTDWHLAGFTGCSSFLS